MRGSKFNSGQIPFLSLLNKLLSELQDLIDTFGELLSCAFLNGAKTSSRGFFSFFFLIDGICPVRFHGFSITHSLFKLFFSSRPNTFFFLLYRGQILSFFSDSAQLEPSKKRKSPPLSKREENPLVTHERGMSTWQVDWVISPRLTMRWWLGMSTERRSIKRNISKRNPSRKKKQMIIQRDTRGW